MNHTIGIMQGRLSPPLGKKIQCFPDPFWEIEFQNAKEAGLQSIEWIYDEYSQNTNPILSSDGISKIKSLSEKYNVFIRSICADYFMSYPLLSKDQNKRVQSREKLSLILKQGVLLNIQRIVLPFVDSSQIKSQGEMDELGTFLVSLLPQLEKTKIEVHLETSLPPKDFKRLLSLVPSPFIRVNYDSGNSASLGFSPIEEFGAYGNHIGSIHIKDRVLGGSTVPLGSGNADFLNLFKEIRKVNYSGDFILQVARGAFGDEVNWAIQNRNFVEGLLNQ